MTARTRSRSTPLDSGYTLSGSTRFNQQPAIAVSENCVDTVGQRSSMNPLSLFKITLDNYPVCNETIGTVRHIGRLPLAATINQLSKSDFDANLPTFQYGRSLLQAIADSHPGKPKVSVPNFIYELKDLPGMIRHFAGLVKRFGPQNKRRKPPTIHDGASSWLAWNFGWAPLFSDLSNMYNVAEGVKRAAAMYLKAQQNNGYVSRFAELGDDSQNRTKNNSTFDTGTFVDCLATSTYDYSSESWICSRWKTSQVLPLYALANGGHRNLLLDQLGFDISFETIYNAIPWSWLVDWCTDASSIIKIYSNQGGWRFSGCVQMEHVKCQKTITATGTKAKYWRGPVSASYELKSRRIVNPSIADVQMNFFNGHQLSILASLLITRFG